MGGREGTTQGKWNFDLPVQSIPAKQSEKEINLNKDLSAIRTNAKLEKVIVTPLRIYLQGTASEKGGPFEYLVLDDKGEVLKRTENQVMVDTSKNNSVSTAAYETRSQNIKSIKVIPYVYGKNTRAMTRKIKFLLIK